MHDLMTQTWVRGWTKRPRSGSEVSRGNYGNQRLIDPAIISASGGGGATTCIIAIFTAVDFTLLCD